MKIPTITVIIPVYNVQDYIERCIKSIKDQTYKQYECIIVDDGSKDNSKQLIQDIIQSDARFKYLYQKNSGPSVARNSGMKEASGEFLVFVDADDYVANNYLEKLYQNIKKEKDLVCCAYLDISKNGKVFINDFSVNNFSKENLVECVMKGTGGVLWGKIFKTNIIKNNEIKFDEKLFMSEDMIFILEYLKYVKKWDVTNEALYCYNRLNETGISRNINYTYISNYVKLNKELEKRLLELNINYVKINDLIEKRMIRFIYQSILSEIKSNSTLQERKKKIEDIMNDKYLKVYINRMETNAKSEKISFIFIKHKMILCTIFYIWLIEKFRSIRVSRYENRNLDIPLC